MIAALSRKHLVLLTIACCAIYANSFSNDFVWDDQALVVNNPLLLDWRNIPQLFTTHLFASVERPSSFYRPLQALTFMVDYHLWGLTPFGFHLTNLLLHLTNAILVYVLVSSLTNSNVAFIAGLLFAVHPLQTEAITYIAGRADPLALGFLLAALLCYRKSGARPGANLWGVASLASFLLALLSKEMAMILPALLILYDLITDPPAHPRELPGRIGRRYLPYLLILGAYLGLRRLITDLQITPEGGATLTFSQRLLLSLRVLAEYLWILVLPQNLHMERTVPVPTSPANLPVLIGALALLLLIGIAYRAWPRVRALTFGIGWFIVGFFPVSNLIPLNAFMAEHWMYLPAIGLFVAIGLAVDATSGHAARKWVIALLAVVLVFDAGTAIMRNREWKDEATFYSLTLEDAPESSRVRSNLGFMYLGKKQFDRAVEALQTAIERSPFEAPTYIGLGQAYEGMGRDQEAIEQFEKAIFISPRAPGAHRRLAQLYLKKGLKERAALHLEAAPEERLKSIMALAAVGDGHMQARRYAEAIEAYRQVLEISPVDAELRSKLGLAYAAKGEPERARQEYEQALKTNPASVNARNYLGAYFMQKETWDDAAKQFQEVLRLMPEHADARNNLGIAYYQMGKLSEAESELRKALALRPSSQEIKDNLAKVTAAQTRSPVGPVGQEARDQPQSARAHYELGASYGNRGDLEKAAKEFDIALSLDPRNPLIHYAIGLIHYQRGARDLAQRAWQQAAKLDPTFAPAKERLAELKAANPTAERAR